MIWRYTAVDQAAMDVTGIAAGARVEVEMRLKGAGLIPVSIVPDLAASLKGLVLGRMAAPERLSFFFRDFANMLEAGLAVEQVLRIFREASGDLSLGAAAGKISDELALGRSLAEALENAKVFPRLAVRAIKAGEKAGNMPLVMELLADHFDLAAELKGKCLGALVYPACVGVFLLAALLYVSGVVVPQLAPLLPAQALREPLTGVMLSLSSFIRQTWVFCLAAGGIVSAGLMVFFRYYPQAQEAAAEAMPIVGAVQKDLQISLCFFDLFILLKSGVPLDAALAEVASCADDPVRRHMGACRQRLAAGHTFSGALAAAGYFPGLVIETVRLGEETGHYDDYCGRVFKAYHRSFTTRVRTMVAILQPLMLGICALFVAVMALAFLKPIYANLTQIGTIQP